jgi:hypothetical protein
MLIHRLYRAAFRVFRPRRLERFYDALGIQSSWRVLDVGGTAYFWSLAAEKGLPLPRVVIVNLEAPEGPLPAFVTWVRADGRFLPFRSGAFDAVFCNSVIEHVGAVESQSALAGEIERVAPRYFVQTPSRRFPVEQHLVTLFLHWLPKTRQKQIMRRLSLAGTIGKLPQPVMERFLDDLRLLDAGEMRRLFPGATIEIERFCGLEKSILALRARPETDIGL